ncbi:MAG: hypothetical protein QXK42_02760 [Candidatus Korarchaeum sp.]
MGQELRRAVSEEFQQDRARHLQEFQRTVAIGTISLLNQALKGTPFILLYDPRSNDLRLYLLREGKTVELTPDNFNELVEGEGLSGAFLDSNGDPTPALVATEEGEGLLRPHAESSPMSSDFLEALTSNDPNKIREKLSSVMKEGVNSIMEARDAVVLAYKLFNMGKDRELALGVLKRVSEYLAVLRVRDLMEKGEVKGAQEELKSLINILANRKDEKDSLLVNLIEKLNSIKGGSAAKYGAMFAVGFLLISAYILKMNWKLIRYLIRPRSLSFLRF